MRLFLDTHAFVWLDVARKRLSTTAQQAIQNPDNTIYLSLVSIWEMQIKIQLGKLHLNASLVTTLASQQETNNLQILAIDISHVIALGNLPAHHHDPFDRLLIAQAQVENLTLVTDDAKIPLYEVPYLW